MRSPFPGMDPYLESPDIWPDFHDQLAGQIARQLNHTLPRPYYARLVMRPEVGIVGEQSSRKIVPDVAIVRPLPSPTGIPAGPAVVDRPRTELSPSVRVVVHNEPLRHHFVEIRDADRDHQLVTLIEIASPSNKRPGPDRRAYESNQQEILGSDTSLIEIDLLRTGLPLVGGAMLSESLGRLQPQPDYLIGISRAWQRGATLDYELFSVRLRDPLPCVPVPLRQGELEVPLDLQYAFDQVYADGPYARGAVDYRVPPDPPVPAELDDWLADCLEQWHGDPRT
jgi:hypothetical protein